MNLPNMLTVVRLLLIPVFIFTFYNCTQNSFITPFVIIVLAGVTDLLDGHIARKYNLVTKLGKLMDPLADKLFQMSVLYVFADNKLIPFWIFYVFLVKELILIIGSIVMYKNKITVSAYWYGKLATILFYIAIITIIFIEGPYGLYALVIAVITTLYAGIRYIVDYLKIRKEFMLNN